LQFFRIPEIAYFFASALSALFMVTIRAGAASIQSLRNALQVFDSITFRFIRVFFYWGPFKAAWDAFWSPFPGVNPPPELYWGQSFDEYGNKPITSNLEILASTGEQILTLCPLVGQPKKLNNGENNFNLFQPFFYQFVKFNFTDRKKGTSLTNNNLPEDYQYFGIDDGVNNLLNFLRYNPFLACALQPVRDDNTNEITHFVIDPFNKATTFGKISSLMNSKYKRVVAVISKDLSSIEKMEVFQVNAYGEPVPDYNDGLISLKDKANMVLHVLVYQSELIHATIHLFHYLMTTCMARATQQYPIMYEWARAYNENIVLKYGEIVLLLFSQYFGALCQSTQLLFNGWMVGPYHTVVALAAALNREWSSYKSAEDFTYKFLFPKLTAKELDDANICVAWRKQVDLVKHYSKDLMAAFVEVNSSDFSTINMNFAGITSTTGPNGIGGVTSVRQFVELMSVTGFLHACTLSFTRVLCTSPMIALMKPEASHFSFQDVITASVATATLIGSVEGHTVFSWGIPYKSVPNKVIQVFQKYSFISAQYKQEYYESIKDRPDFKYYGFIFTDHGPDEIDGKQYTLSTYI